MKNIFTPLRAAVLATLLGAIAVPVIAQTADAPVTDRAIVDRDVDDDDGFDWGLLGLLGLLGLIPRKQHHVVHDPNRTNTNPNSR